LNINVILHIIKSSKLLLDQLMGKELGVLRDFEAFLSQPQACEYDDDLHPCDTEETF